MKRLVEDFDDMMNIEDEVSVEDTKSPLEKELIRVYEYLKDKGETDIKAYEVAYQEAIENIYPENSWWEVIDLNIFWDLFENQNPRTTIDNIISSIKPEFKKEVIDTVVTEDIEEENPLKDIRSNIIEFPNGEYAYVEYADGKLYAGSATNRGIIHEYEMDYDKDYDVDRNLQDFFDKIIEENPELGEPLDESKKVCEDTVKQGNKWVNKGKDGTHGTFRTKKAADAQRKAMFANKGKKSTFGESFKVGDTFTNAGEEWEILRSEGDYTLVYAKDRKFHPYVVVYMLDDDGTWAQGHYFSNKDSAEKFLMNETMSMNESVRRKKRAIKESDDDFVIFEQESDQARLYADWYFDDDGIDYYIDGGSDFIPVNEDFLYKEVNNEAIHKAFGDIGEGDEFYIVKDIFGYFDGDDITSALSAGLGEDYEDAILTGSVQREWATIYYPKHKYSRNDINIIEDYYFDKVTGWYNDDYGDVVITDTELGSHYNDPAKIKEIISDYTGVPVDEIKLRGFDGYDEVDDYIDESKQRRRSNRCVTEAKKEKLDKTTKQRIKVFKELFDVLLHWNNNFSHYTALDKYTLENKVQKLLKKLGSTRSSVGLFINSFKSAYKILLKAGVSLDRKPSTIKRLADNLSQKYMKLADEWKDNKYDMDKSSEMFEVYYHYASEFEDLSDFVDEVNAEINKDIKEKLSKKTKAKRIYESMKKKRDKLKESRLSANSSTNIKDSSTEGYVYTYCDECGKKNRVKVVFNSFKEPFNDTEYKCEYCGTRNMLTDPHKYDEDGYIIEASHSYGGAFDIKDDQYFTRDDLVEFAEDVVDGLNAISFSRFDYTEVYLEPGNNLELTITWSDYEETIREHIDMRKIRKPSDLSKVYAPLFINRAKELFSELGADFDLHLSDQDYPLSEEKKPKKNLKEAADDEIKLFMNTWANYNENGADDGITPTGWMSLDEAEEYAKKYAEYEPFINDTENVPKELGVGEYSNISETIDMLRKYEDFDDTEREVFAAFIDDGYEVDEAFDIVDDNDYIYVQADNDTDLAYNYIDEIGGVENLDRNTRERYFDYDAFGRDLAYDFIETENGYVSR